MREEQALAKLSHPNVVNVHDTGVFEARTFVVMELVVGTSAREWLEDKPRLWREVVQVFMDAGRGLAASHAVGLVHRDFKPENVIVGADGRARVTDFGLARALPGRVSTEETTASGEPRPEELGASSIAGTPAYMAPEQFRGQRADERSDQFSFCVALYRALYGQPPFSKRAERTQMAVFAREVLSGKVRPPPPGTEVPLWLDRLIRRGLRTDPKERFPSMEALLDEMSRSFATSSETTAAPRPLSRLLPVLALGATAALLLTAGLRDWGRQNAVGAAEDRCGDGQVRAGVEECDDGNHVDGDGCSSRCLRCTQGDARLVWQANGRCYTRHDRAASWTEAEGACRAMGAHLVTLNVWAELREVHERLLGGRPARYWIGFNDLSGSGDYGWTTGEPTNPLLPWASLRPPPGRCGLYDPQGDIARPLKPWSAESCDAAHGFVCEKEEARIGPPATGRIEPSDGRSVSTTPSRHASSSARVW